MTALYDQIQESAAALKGRWNRTPKVGIILGTGLGGLAEEITADDKIPYDQIPHFLKSTVASHKGQLVVGTLEGQTVMAMEGRFHAYEGYSLQSITFPVRVMKAMGCEVLIVSNACGGLNPQYSKGDLMVIEDHINLMGDNPLIGPNDDRLGDRFPDMCYPYDRELIAKAMQIALEERIVCHKGVYSALKGPCLETRAEYRFLRTIGADVIGMSTIPEVIVGVHSKMRILGFSIITDMCLADALEPVSLPEIIATANTAEKKLRTIVKRVLASL
ncbi:purine-nucleoside phosphorylase [Tuwongella immobilis]|uniref:Purine nucleoside phosphorylase n=1 Tax=Tuwongella immobilis TaxID=692036 RepID=A0A6C2YM28_9BACT|nr:purine-nucleoside phosphorylase [Tuwongella immobilis]VIP02486.1 purine nucleoside phosphorylase : Purine nucleoside phosphorylase OS=Singulisphaera acidiphila (strain ATCC BAA-1392 / DSM 18658 / VKM B-2454 / MOB10) GN=Sinac_1303 PE=3 SV=1: PNP_UDP_1 [Tuwongella immobilis]VTS01544.1 purine nucleoside phosphorylase : Purine nucleoside phosphorylase OS=Singulisphaera acidiphila (strain ATCC BAA-1392 / DSM 18658 / VKM B-2454 / MOB10) GN=Sinac_1303 PE=3 SV=1: PNP_UDP_1 [Tuwongella immobilis]